MRDVPLRRLCSIVNGGTPTPDESNWGGDIPWATPVDLGRHHGKEIAGTDRSLTLQGLESGSAIAPAGSALLSTRAPIGYVALNDTAMAFNQGCRALLPGRKMDVRFLTYALLHLRPHLESLGTGSTFMELSTTALASSRVRWVPDVVVQQQIAGFLDRQTAKIDALIAKQEQLVAALLQHQSARLMKYTMAPGPDWTRTTIGRVLEKLDRPADVDAPIITAYRDGAVTTRETRREDGYTLSFTEGGYQGISRGDVVFHALDGFAGAVGVSDSNGKCSPVYHVCRPGPDHDSAYLALHLRTLGATGMLTAFAWSVRQRSVDYRNWPLFASLPIVVPPRHAQEQVATDVACDAERVNALIGKTRELIEAMRQRRAALITAAVTGQLDVTAHAS